MNEKLKIVMAPKIFVKISSIMIMSHEKKVPYGFSVVKHDWRS